MTKQPKKKKSKNKSVRKAYAETHTSHIRECYQTQNRRLTYVQRT